MFLGLRTTARIRIVADCGLHSCQVTKKLKRATTLEITTEPAIIFIHLYISLTLLTMKITYLCK